MEMETTRLKIIALTPDQLETLSTKVSALEKEFNCSYEGEAIEGSFQKILYEQSLKAKANRPFYLWLTFWLIIKKEENKIIGTIDFKNIPNAQGEVEIGYGLGKSHEHFGYMTEAVGAFCAWTKKQKNVQYIIAETEGDNIPSQRVLQRCGFTQQCNNKTILWKFS